MEFIDLKSQYRLIEEKVQSRVQTVLEHGAYIMGPEVGELEKSLARYVGVEHCVSCANGTDALQLALMALDVGPGDAVFTTPFTFFATAEAIAVVGATPVFVDIDEATFNISPELLQDAIESFDHSSGLSPKAIIAVDLFGLPADYLKIEAIAKAHGLKLIEDGAQGFGGEVEGRKACSFGDIATTSFFPAKPLGCYGDGGAIFTSDTQLADKVRSLRVHGKGSDKYDNVRIGLNSRLDTLQAAVLLEKIEIFPQEVAARNQLADWYQSEISEIVGTPEVPAGFISSWAQYTIKVPPQRRDSIISTLKEAGIPSQVYYRTPLHLMRAFEELNLTSGSFPISEKVSQSVMSLPMHGYSDKESAMNVCEAIKRALA